jgi:cytochrome c-type biogenesis protein CcmH/NrfG
LSEIEKNQNGTEVDSTSSTGNAYPYWHLSRLVLSIVVCVVIVFVVASYDKCG